MSKTKLSYSMPIKMKCSRCGKEAEGQRIFCESCGGKMEEIKTESGMPGFSPAQTQVHTARETQYLAIIIGLVIVAVAYLGYTNRGKIQELYNNLTHARFKSNWELTDYLDKTQNEVIKDFPYKLDDDFSILEEEGMTSLDFEAGRLESVMVVGKYSKVSIYGMKTGMSIQEIKKIIENRHMLLLSEDEKGLMIEPEDSYSIISIVLDSNYESCMGWNFTRGENLSAEKKRAETEACIEKMKNQSFQKYQCTYGEVFESLYGEDGSWSYSMAWKGLDTMDGDGKGLRYEAGEDFYTWYVDGEEIIFQGAFFQEDFWDGLDELETELAKVIPNSLLVSAEDGQATTNKGGVSSSESIDQGNSNNNASSQSQSIIRSNGYILPYSDSMYYSESDLESLTAEELRIARNEIYARYGRKFKDEQLQRYFASCSWYYGDIEPEDFQESSLNEYEMANRDLIKRCEEGGQASNTQNAGTTSDVAGVIIGIWHNGYTDWATNYHTIFYEDGSVEHFGYRNYDSGYFVLGDGENEVIAYFDQYQDVPGEGYVYSGSYTCYYYYNPSNGFLERIIYPGEVYDDFTNDGEGILQKVSAIVESSY